MTAGKHFLLNGTLQPEDGRLFGLDNRALSQGDCIKEIIHSCGDRLCFFQEHMEHLRQGMEKAQMQIPEKFKNANDVFYNEVSKLLSKNRTFRSSNVTIMAYRSAVTNTPAPDPSEYLVTADPVNYLGYEINKDGLRIDIYEDSPWPTGPMGAYITHGNGPMKAALRKLCLHKRLHDMILLSADGNIIESSMGGNIFIIKDGTIMTPPESDGCSTDVFRTKVLEAARACGLSTGQSMHLTPADMENCSEVFLGSTVYGIRWIGAYRNRRFIKSKSQAIHTKINEMYQAERTGNPDEPAAI